MYLGLWTFFFFIKKGVCLFFFLMRCLLILKINPLSVILFENCFHLVGCLSVLFMVLWEGILKASCEVSHQ